MQHQWVEQSQRLLTARQVQHLLNIDRSTVYRMASDGRLPTVRVGRQLRFPADQLPAAGAAEADSEVAATLDAVAAEAAVAVAADLLGVTMVVTDMHGRPLTRIVNPSAWFLDNAGSDALDECLQEWRSMADDTDLAPRFIVGTAGFECARAFIRSGSSLVGMVLAGGVATPEAGSAHAFHELDAQQRDAVLRTLPRIAAILGVRTARSLPEIPASPATLPVEEWQ